MDDLNFLPPIDGHIWRFTSHRLTCVCCGNFDGQTRNLGQLCLQGAKALKDDWVEIEHHNSKRAA